jgi:hypothetical protein
LQGAKRLRSPPEAQKLLFCSPPPKLKEIKIYLLYHHIIINSWPSAKFSKLIWINISVIDRHKRIFYSSREFSTIRFLFSLIILK